MSKLYESEIITGLANITVNGGGITSTDAEPKKLTAVILTVVSRNGNVIEGWYERERRLMIIDHQAALPAEAHRLRLPIDFEISIGKTWRVAVRSGGTPTTVHVAYEYELI